ncbi:DUF4846 domain-containing protein [Vallitalea maricola]|uniref:DUF4846 domain-containing protein n=1 Tax=Vallitalea maricola TaxID=3074433 RepID=A0ACB5UDU6_9FIRM|nr:DUF4846 domain-containing protein [Vallitalea sp. AN17-2]
MKQYIVLIIMIILVTGCATDKDKSDSIPEIIGDVVENNNDAKIEEKEEKDKEIDIADVDDEQDNIINSDGKTVQERFNVPDNYERVKVEEKSFGEYLRNLPLKPHGSKVKYYDGNIKDRTNVYEAVIDMSIGDKNLQQCADAIMRLRGEYLFGKGDYNKIHFNFTNGFRVDYSKWIDGYRIKIDGNKTEYVKKTQPSNTYEDFLNYMEYVFMYAGTLSLSKELKDIEIEDMEIGDIFIKGGSPGHAVIVIDMAVNKETGEKLYMLAQSYMPAQDIQVLCNGNNKELNPWYRLNDDEIINTPEWTFNRDQLKRFE